MCFFRVFTFLYDKEPAPRTLRNMTLGIVLKCNFKTRISLKRLKVFYKKQVFFLITYLQNICQKIEVKFYTCAEFTQFLYAGKCEYIYIHILTIK